MKFTEKYHKLLAGAISGFDRIRFRGTLRRLTCTENLGKYLSMRGILLKDFKEYVRRQTARLVGRVEARARDLGIPYLYLARARLKTKEAEELSEKGIKNNIIPFSLFSHLI